MSPEMIFNEVAPQTPKNKVDKTTTVLSTLRDVKTKSFDIFFCCILQYLQH